MITIRRSLKFVTVYSRQRLKKSPEPEPEMSCIRCSECAEACPVELLPQQLLWYAQSEDHKKLEAYDLIACIECGACAFVCPSHIPLVEYYRVAKAQIRTAKEEAIKQQLHVNAMKIEIYV